MSKIQWTDETWNPVTGCSIVSPGCTNCYAMREAGGRLKHHKAYKGLTKPSKTGPVWTGEVRLLPDRLEQPLRWTKPRMVFVNSMSDLFHEDIPNEYIGKVFYIMAQCPEHTFQILTKRAERMRHFVNATLAKSLRALPNVWLGVSCEDQERYYERAGHLEQTITAVSFLSLEPLLGSINLYPHLDWVKWVIVGGESGPRARVCAPNWIRDIVTQCRDLGVPCFVKQLGQNACWKPMKSRKGDDPAEWPADLCVREYPV